MPALRRRIPLAFCIAAALARSATGANGAVVLAGKVEDARTGAALPGISVVVLPATGATQSAITGADGRFAIAAIPPGQATVIVFGQGVRDVVRTERFAPEERAIRRYAVTMGFDEDLIVVTAPGGAAQPVQTVVDAAEARRVPGTEGDPLQAVSSLAGVARPAPGSQNLVIWGASPGESRTLVDGVEVPSLHHLGGVRGVLGPEVVSKIALVPGAYGADYGRALGGLVQVTTVDLPDRPHGAVAADLLDASGWLTAPVAPWLRLAVAGKYGYLDRLAGGFADPSVAALYPLPAYDDYQVKASARLGTGEQIDLLLLGSHDSLRTTNGASDPSTAQARQESLDWQRLALRYTHRLADASVLVVPFVGLTRDASSTGAGTALASQDRHDVVGGLRASYATDVTSWLALTLGLDGLFTRSRIARAGTLTIPAREGDPYVFGQPPGDDFERDVWTAVVGDLGAHASFALHRGRWTLEPELRADAFPVAGSRLLPPVGATPTVGFDHLKGALDPRASVVCQMSPALAVNAAAGAYHQPVDAADLSAVFGSPSLGPSRAVHAAAGLWWRAHAVTVELTAFGRLSSALVLRNPAPSPPLAGALIDDGQGRTAGAEVLVRRDAGERLSGWLAYTGSRSERRHESSPSYRLADFDQTHVLTAVVVGRLDRRGAWLVSGRARYATGIPRTPVVGASYDLRDARWDPIFGPPNAVRLPPFFQLDARFEHVTTWGSRELAVYLDVQNVTDHANAEEILYARDYARSGYVRGLPILPVAGARWRF